jgi:ABC-type polysaccharide/polyol phosphate transport system ATPase subunit
MPGTYTHNRLAQASDAGNAVEVNGLSKSFRLVHEHNQSLKAAVLRRGRLKYEEFPALKDVSFSIPRGSTFALVGTNGSGKSTLLKCLARILRPDSGDIKLWGSMSALLELGAGFHPELSGRENVYLNASILGMKQREIDRRFDEIVSFAGLERFIDTPVKNYSSGMYVRLGFSVAISVEPDVLLVDEVLAVGDESFQRKCAEKFAEFRDAGRTIVVVSHALSTVRSLCDQAIWLDNGVVKMTGSGSEIVDAYLGEVHVDRRPDGDNGARWGSGEYTISQVELLDDAGKPIEAVCNGATLRVRYRIDAADGLVDPVLGIAFVSVDGVGLSGATTQQIPFATGTLKGNAVIDFVVPNVSLMPGVFDISVSLSDHTGLKVYDFRQKVKRFDVQPGVVGFSNGLVSLGGEWQAPTT